jgi:mannose-6-phosphate isomerase-like protein (cupin superfamily)
MLARMDLLRDLSAAVASSPDKMRKHGVFETTRFFCDVYVLAPGQAQAPHAHERSDKVYAVLSGAGSIRVGTDVFAVRAGHAVHCPAASSHGVENPGPDDLRLLVFVAPHPKPPA